MKTFNTPKLKFLYRLLFLFMALFTFYRIFFLIGFKNELTVAGKNVLASTLFMGLRFDFRLTMALLIPAIIGINLPLNPKFKDRMVSFIYLVLFFLVNLAYILDAGYFSYLRSRINATVIAFLKNPLISFQMVKESYPWFLITILLVIITAGIFFLFLKLILPLLSREKTSNSRTIKISRIILFLLIFTEGLYGSVQMYPLRWSEAFQSTDAFTSNLALNPILYIVDTYSFRKSDFDEDAVKKSYPFVSDFLGVIATDPKKLNFLRDYAGNPEKLKNHPNVVVIIMESMAYFKTGIGGSKVNPTPYLDNIARESLLFDRFYTPTVATARSVFAAVTSLPDISKVQTGTRNPFVVDQNTIMGQAVGYEKFYFLGGSANWGNIRGVLSYNIPGLHIFEEGSYKSPRVDVWGISDLDLFNEAAENLGKRENPEKPFISIIQSAGFHRPYTIPRGSIEEGFKILTEKDIDPKIVKQYGFESMEEFNAMRLQDFSLGKFMEKARKTSWYNNTIFMVFGDHGIPHNNALNVPEWSKFNANGYHVPFIIHSPKFIKTGIESKIASEMDVMPTIAGLIGIPYKMRGLGKDLFNPDLDKYRAAFSYNWYPPFHITLVDKDFYFEYIPYNGNGQLIKYSENDNTVNVKDKYPEKYKEMEDLTKGLYETSKYLLHHNPKTY